MTVTALALKAFKNMGRIKGNDWNEMTTGIKGMLEVNGMGGIGGIMIPVISRISETASLQVLDLFSPIINEITTFLGRILGDEGLNKKLNDFTFQLTRLITAIGDIGGYDYLLSQLEQMIYILGVLARLITAFTDTLWSRYNESKNQGCPDWLAFMNMFSPIEWGYTILEIIGNWWKTLWGG